MRWHATVAGIRRHVASARVHRHFTAVIVLLATNKKECSFAAAERDALVRFVIAGTSTNPKSAGTSRVDHRIDMCAARMRSSVVVVATDLSSGGAHVLFLPHCVFLRAQLELAIQARRNDQ